MIETSGFSKRKEEYYGYYGVALLAGCYMAGNVIGDILGALLGVKANIGGVGFAMLFLIIISAWAQQKGIMKAPEDRASNGGLRCTSRSL